MITFEQYFGPWIDHPDATPERKENARAMLVKVNGLLIYIQAQHGYAPPVNPVTGSQISGQTYGGFRPQDCPQGAPGSSHKEGRAPDVYDPMDKLDSIIDDSLLEKFGLYREHPDSTPGWCHLTDRAPKSGHRTFYP